MSSRQKTALVTGCSKGGIGDAMAQELHRHGYRVFATIRDEAKGAHLREIGINDLVFMDVTDAEAISRAVDLVKEATGGVLDILVNNAGAAYASSMADVDIVQAKRMFDVNYFGVLVVTQAFTPLLVASGDARVINIGSILGVVHRPFTGVYNSAKAALTVISDTMRVELAPFGIKVIHVVTGGISTNFIASGYAYTFPETSIYEPIREQALPFANGARIQQAMITPAEEYARAVVANAVKKSPTAEFWYGAETTMVWIFSLFFPKWLLDSLYTNMCGFNRLAEIVGLSREKTKDT